MQTSSRSRLVILRKFIIIFVTCLAGLNIYLMLDLFLYKGLEFKHYFFMGFPVIVAAYGWSSWPKRVKDPILQGLKDEYKRVDRLHSRAEDLRNSLK